MTDFQYSRSKFYKTIFSVIFSSSILESVNSMEVVKGAITAVFTYATTGQNHSVPQASQDLVQKYHNLINERDVKRLQAFCNKEIKQHYSQYELATHKDEKDLWEKSLKEWVYKKNLGTEHIQIANKFIDFCKNERERNEDTLRNLKTQQERLGTSQTITESMRKASEEMKKREWQIKNIERLLKKNYPITKEGSRINRIIESAGRKGSRLINEWALFEEEYDAEKYRSNDHDAKYNDVINSLTSFPPFSHITLEQIKSLISEIKKEEEKARLEDNQPNPTQTSRDLDPNITALYSLISKDLDPDQTTADPTPSPASALNTSQDEKQVPSPNAEGEADSKAQLKEQPTTQALITTNPQPSGQQKTNKKGKK